MDEIQSVSDKTRRTLSDPELELSDFLCSLIPSRGISPLRGSFICTLSPRAVVKLSGFGTAFLVPVPFFAIVSSYQKEPR